MATTKRSSRRSLLGGLLAVAGLGGTGLAAKLATGDAATNTDRSIRSAPGALESIGTLYVDRYTLHTGATGVERHKGDQSLLRGTLLTADGKRAGELFASAVTMPGPVDDDSPRTPRMEVQSLQLHDGTIMAMGTVFAQADIPNVYIVIGGTGSYVGARGTYTFDNNPNVARPDGRATVRFHLNI